MLPLGLSLATEVKKAAESKARTLGCYLFIYLVSLLAGTLEKMATPIYVSHSTMLSWLLPHALSTHCPKFMCVLSGFANYHVKMLTRSRVEKCIAGLCAGHIPGE